MPAPLLNTFAMKFKTPEERKELCRKYCEHMENGYSDISFTECDPDTVQKYIKDFPDDFPTDLIEQARRKRIYFWETIGIHGTVGKLKGFNAKSWEFNMKNRFGWKDRQDITSDDEKFEGPIIYIPQEDTDK